MATSYATVEQLQDFLGAEAPSDADRLLARASELVDSAIRLPYATDDDGIATDADFEEAIRNACCAQVEMWIEVGEENDVDGLAGTQVSISSYSGPRAPELSPRAFRLLHNAGLLSMAVCT